MKTVIQFFRDAKTETIFNGEFVKGLAHDIQTRTLRKLVVINNAHSLEDLRMPRSNRLHRLQNGYWSLSINDQWRITFLFENGEAKDVGIEDYHK